MKLQQVRKRLIKEGLIAGAGVAIALVIYIGVSSWASGALGKKTDAENRLNQQRGEISALRSKIDNADASQKTYAALVEKRGNDSFTIDNNEVRDVLEELIRRYRISIDGKLEYSAEEKLALPELASVSSGFVVRKDAALKFKAISDLHVYAFLDALAKELPGMLQYKSFTIARKEAMDNNALAQLALGRETYLVEAAITFDWYGIVPAAKNMAATAADNTPSQPGVLP